ncbi:TPA: ATPase [Streptococcus suis]
MKINLQKDLEKYQLTIAYTAPASLTEAWDLLATDAGFSLWFPQLKIEEDKLVFEMENFRETMDLLAYRPHEEIAYSWDRAKVTFSLSQQEQETHILFEEEIPVDFGNKFADAKKDMTGWLVQNECIQALLHHQELPDHKPLQEKWAAFLEEELKQV